MRVGNGGASYAGLGIYHFSFGVGSEFNYYYSVEVVLGFGKGFFDNRASVEEKSVTVAVSYAAAVSGAYSATRAAACTAAVSAACACTRIVGVAFKQRVLVNGGSRLFRGRGVGNVGGAGRLYRCGGVPSGGRKSCCFFLILRKQFLLRSSLCGRAGNVMRTAAATAHVYFYTVFRRRGHLML